MNEALEKDDNKKLFRELVKKYHPDNKDGNEEIMKKLNKAKDDGDKAFEIFYASYLNKPRPKEEQKEEMKMKRPAHFKTDEAWFKWHEKVKAKREKEQEKLRKKK